METVVIYGTGSPVLADVEESLLRAGIGVCAAVRNVPGESYFSRSECVLSPEAVRAHVKSIPFLAPFFTPANRQQASCEARRWGFERPFSLIDPSVATPKSLEYAEGLYVNTGVSIGGACVFDAF